MTTDPMRTSSPPLRPSPLLETRGLTRRYAGGGGVEAIDLAVAEGERLAVVGPSGSGKTTLLRLIAGLERPDAGEVRLDGRPATSMPPRSRGLSMVFQHQPPYPHLNVAENLAFGLKARGMPRAEVREQVARIAGWLGLDPFLTRTPAHLSGGQRQRVVLGRALATRPRLALLDEPFSALDPPLRIVLRADLIDLHRRQGGAMVLVTHDQAEAMAFGHRLAVIRDGRIIQLGEPEQIYDRPSHRFVAEFLGNPGASILRCLVRHDPDAVRIDGLVPGASWAVPRGLPWAEALAGRPAPDIDLALRPEHVAPVGPTNRDSIQSGPGDGPHPTVIGRVDRVEPQGATCLVLARVGPHRLWFRSTDRPAPRPGDRVPLRLRLARADWFDPGTGNALSAK